MEFDFWGSNSCAIFFLVFLFPLLVLGSSQFQKRCLFLLDLHSNIWYVLFLHWWLEELLGFRVRRVCLYNPSFVLVWSSIGFRIFLGLQSIEAFARDAIDFENSGFFIT